MKLTPETKKRLKKAAIWITALGSLAAVVLALAFSVTMAWISRSLPDPNTLITREVPLTTKIYDRTGTKLLYEVHGEENRTLVQIKDLPDYVPHATVAIEDKNFYTHHGISWRGLVRAVVVNTLQGKRIQGTSTLTQQLVRNAILTTERSTTRKAKEILLSLQLERVLTKDQILQLYLNEVPYGPTSYGIESASQNYFGKSAKDLTVDEAALLAAIPQSPDRYSPYGTSSRGDFREVLLGRQQYIIEQMLEQGYITQEQADNAKKVETLKKLVPQKVANIQAPHFVMYVKSLLIEKYGQGEIERKGYKVITSLDLDKQKIAEEEVAKGVDALGPKYGFENGALVSLDPKTGQVLAMVGSKDFFSKDIDGQVNVTLQPRQPGSSFKPIVYAAGFAKGYTPETTLWDVNTSFKTDTKNYEPKNYDFKEHGPISVRMALQGSLNIPAVKMLYLVGVNRVLDFADSLGYSTLKQRERFGLALVLGGGEVKPLEHANAYAAFANQGIQYDPVAILKVEDASGKTLEEWKQTDGRRVMEPGVAATVSDVLSDNNARAYVFGQKNNLMLAGRPVAAKSGTTNDFHDAWTMGYTPSLVAGVWVGNNDNTEMKRGADGSKIAAPIWQAYMTRALGKAPAEKFPTPPPNTSTKPVLQGKAMEAKLRIDKVSGKLATANTPPELVEERTFREAHDILWYLDKDDPAGPPPQRPEDDPQFANWESAVQTWVKKGDWASSTGMVPTEFDDVHTSANQPVVVVNEPAQNAVWSSRSGTVSAFVTAPRRITQVVVVSEGQTLATQQFAPWTIPVQLPNSFDRGAHDLVVIATDDVGNKGMATVTVNLNAESQPLSASVTSLSNGMTVSQSSLPLLVTVRLSDVTNVKKIDLYLQSADGSTRLIGTEIAPKSLESTVQWSINPGAGSYSLFPVATDGDGSAHQGQSISIEIGQ